MVKLPFLYFDSNNGIKTVISQVFILVATALLFLLQFPPEVPACLQMCVIKLENVSVERIQVKKRKKINKILINFRSS